MTRDTIGCREEQGWMRRECCMILSRESIRGNRLGGREQENRYEFFCRMGELAQKADISI